MEIVEFSVALNDRNPSPSDLGKKGIWELTKLVSSQVGQASGRVGCWGTDDAFMSVSPHPIALFFSAVFPFRVAFPTQKELQLTAHPHQPLSKSSSSPRSPGLFLAGLPLLIWRPIPVIGGSW